ncbi:MAG TPA: UDP-3-O-(3-hydroxymyristoyl)glucosamine N-acyltransferase [bacterium]|nr:UDP-3-O-(3-hydroxymyristoyl)glucosamine N-acyltransferase [bacterium]HNS48755.1 UDP-3-O-(3-hydroxymyristoyl)glucosamine N-acyltransferase [bacterium]
MQITVKELAKLVGGRIIGDPDQVITGVSGIKEAEPGEITFVANRRYYCLMEGARASAILVPPEITSGSQTLIQVENPSLAFARIVALFGPEPVTFPPGIHPTAVIGERVRLGRDVSIQPYVVIEDNVSIGDRTVLCAGVYVGHYSRLGDDCLVYPHVSIRERVAIGNRVIIHGGAVIGGDGFGFATVRGIHEKIPQIGTVILEDDVEIGSCVTIDRARFDDTLIKRGVKIDNLVQIAHNVTIGENSIVVAQVGISGSTTIGRNVIIAGQAGVVGHIEVGDNAVIAAKAGVTKDIAPGAKVSGFPAREHSKDMKLQAYIHKQPELWKKILELEKRIEELEKNGQSGDH